jgi:dethiobiotin synthetase
MKVIYIAGFRQHAGKTSTSLGLISLLKKHIPAEQIGYIKPVGQELYTLPDGTRIDKDGKIIEQFVLPHIDMSIISPVRLGSGVTKDFLKSPNPAMVTREYEAAIYKAMDAMKDKKIIIAEGTGHPGVGAIVGLSSARVSLMMKGEILFLAGGGVGKTLDMLETDMNYLKMKGARVKGIIFNKILKDKVQGMKDLVNEDLINRYFGTPTDPISVLGYFPEVKGLNRPSMKLIKNSFRDPLESGNDPLLWEKPIGDIRIISLTHEEFNPEEYIKPGDLAILTADSRRRLQKLMEYHTSKPAGEGLSGVILTCCNDSECHRSNRELVSAFDLPALYLRDDTSSTDAIIHEVISNTKIQPWDGDKMKQIERLFEEHFDFEKFLHTFHITL